LRKVDLVGHVVVGAMGLCHGVTYRVEW
jgi:hypothetical protein